MRKEALRLHDVTLLQDGSVQLAGFSMYIDQGEILGLLQLHGHGVSALLELLQRNLPLRSGSVWYQERRVNSWQDSGRGMNRIAVIRYPSALVGSLTVADNIFVLRPGFRQWLIRPGVLMEQTQIMLSDLDVVIDADACVDTLSDFEKIVVELVKAAVSGCRLIILREISTQINAEELDALHRILKVYAAQGIAFLYISFHRAEMEMVCQRIAVYSDGRILKYLLPADWAGLNTADAEAGIVKPERALPQTAPVLQMENLCSGRLHGLSLEVAPGECVVLQDVPNAVFEDLIPLLLGKRKAEKGQIRLMGKPLSQDASRNIAILREQPCSTMIFETMSYLDNLCFTADHKLPAIWRSRKLRDGIRREFAAKGGDEVFRLPVAALSKKQRYDLVFQRILLQRPKVLFCFQPFQGADNELQGHIQAWIDALQRAEIAIVILTSNSFDAPGY